MKPQLLKMSKTDQGIGDVCFFRFWCVVVLQKNSFSVGWKKIMKNQYVAAFINRGEKKGGGGVLLPDPVVERF